MTLMQRATSFLRRAFGSSANTIDGYVFGNSLRDDGFAYSRRNVHEAAHGLVAAIATAISQRVAHVPLYISDVTQTADGARKVVNEAHPLATLLWRPNPVQTGHALRAEVSESLAYYGEAFIYLEKAGPNAAITGLRFLRPDTMQHVIDARLGLVGWLYNESGFGANGGVPLRTDEICHIRIPNIIDRWRGISPIVQQSLAVQTQHQLSDYARRLAGRSGRVDVVLSVDADSPEQLEAYRKRFSTVYGNARRGDSVLAIPRTADVKPLGLKPADMEFVELNRITELQILRAYRMPKELLGDSSSGGWDNAEPAERHMLRGIVSEFLLTVTEAIETQILSQYPGSNVLVAGATKWQEITHPSVLPEDAALTLQKAVQLINSPIATVNEARAIVGLPPVDNGNVILYLGNSLDNVINELGNPKETPQSQGTPRAAAILESRMVAALPDLAAELRGTVKVDGYGPAVARRLGELLADQTRVLSRLPEGVDPETSKALAATLIAGLAANESDLELTTRVQHACRGALASTTLSL